MPRTSPRLLIRLSVALAGLCALAEKLKKISG